MAKVEERYLTDIAHQSDLKRASDGDLQLITGVANAKHALFHRLMTSPGTLVHRPTYGVGIKDYQNAVFDLENQRSLARRIKDQFEQDFRVESIEGLRITQDDTVPGKIVIFIRVELRGFGETELNFIPFGETV